ncbi:MAG TPA: delta(1)-pyrroline-2-carboxylate reductase family protein [Castellaniella sp.]|uniref:delta(1)-pyrroline-2-carboxylate reductase family protein n=1 Tax=Castellaniella sp. TaxID=1955812 RepID=UPI002EE3EFDE
MIAQPVTVLDAIHTEALLPYEALMQGIAQAAREVRAGLIHAPARQALPLSTDGTLISMPATGSDVAVHKLVSVIPSNKARGWPTINGIVSIYDSETGRLQLLLDGPTVTVRRTVAVSMLGLSLLCPQGPQHAAIYGTGTQARGHARALLELYPAARVDIIGHTLAKAREFVRACGDKRLQPVDTVESATDLVITTTTSARPVYDEAARAERLVIAVGAYRADLAEIAPRTLAGSTLYVDDLEGARHEAGDYLQAGVDWQAVHGLADLLERRPADLDACVFKTVGCAAWDLAAARCALQHRSIFEESHS